MKKKSTSRSAFFNLRVLIGLFVGMTGISLALLAANPFGQKNSLSAAQLALIQQKYGVASSSIDPLVPAAIDCSRIKQLGIDRQENLRAGAIMIFCGLSEGGKASHGKAFSKLAKKLLSPLAFGSTDVDLITGAESFPNVTQSETFTTANPDNPNQIVVAYNDSRGRNFTPINISGASVSTDGGTTFTRLTKATGQSPFDNTFGDPVVLYHKPSGNWVTVWLDAACGGQGLGGYKSLTPDDPNSWTHFCAFNEGSADRESGWADNNPGSPFFGSLYISWNDFNVGNANIFVIRSTDGGTTWSSPVMVSTQPTFIRNTQITGDLGGNGTIYIAGMDEGGGGFPQMTRTSSSNQPTVGRLGAIPTPARRSRDLALALSVTSPSCLPISVVTGGTRAGVSLLPSTTLFTWSMPSTEPAVMLATSITFAPPTVV